MWANTRPSSPKLFRLQTSLHNTLFKKKIFLFVTDCDSAKIFGGRGVRSLIERFNTHTSFFLCLHWFSFSVCLIMYYFYIWKKFNIVVATWWQKSVFLIKLNLSWSTRETTFDLWINQWGKWKLKDAWQQKKRIWKNCFTSQPAKRNRATMGFSIIANFGGFIYCAFQFVFMLTSYSVITQLFFSVSPIQTHCECVRRCTHNLRD